MDDYKEIIKKRLQEIPEVLRSFILDEKWRTDAERIGRQFKFDENKYASFENEIFLVLIALEPRNDFEENIKKELGIDSNMAGWITEDVNKSIFDKVTNKLKPLLEKEEQAPKSVGNSFEQIILNQAKAMQPARPADESGRSMNYESRIMEGKKEIPENIPTKPQHKMHDYKTGEDPYREPPV